jgi:hypothetical protein
MNTPTLYDQAQARVDSDPRLKAHEETILYDWPEGDEHWSWIVSASVEDIVNWAALY